MRDTLKNITDRVMVVGAVVLFAGCIVAIGATVYGTVKAKEVRIIDATNPRISFAETDAGSDAVYIDYAVSTDTLEFYTGFSSSSVLFQATTVGGTTNDVLKLESSLVTIEQTALFNSSFNGVGGTHTDSTVANVTSSNDGFKTTNSSSGDALTWQVLGDGTMEWGGASDTNLYRNAASELKTDDSLIVAIDLDVDGELEGSRSVISFGTNTNISADRYISFGTTNSSTQGFIAARAGSIVEVSGSCEVNGLGVASTTVSWDARKGGVSQFQTTTVSTATSGTKTNYATAARDDHTFVAGNSIQCRIDVTGTPSLDNCQCHVGIVYDN